LKTAYQFEQCTPEAEGIPATAIKAFVDEVEESGQELHSFMLLRHGRLLAQGWWQPYRADLPHILFSLSKSFTSTAVGLAVAEGKLSLDDKVISFFPEETPAEVSPNLAAMQVRHLLGMSTGHAVDTMQAIDRNPLDSWVKAVLSVPVEYAPGTYFLYNTGASYLLSAIVQKVTGQTLLEYLQPRLFEPLGIEHATWESSPQGINTGGFGLSLTTSEVARFGQLYLQKGKWQGRQILPESWVEEATASHISNGDDPHSDWAQGYGYQFWRCQHGAYRGDGAFGQYCVIMPEQEVVLAITSGLSGDMQAVLNLVWKHLLPAMQAEKLPENPAAQQMLAQKLQNLALPTVKSQPLTAIAEQVSGKRFVFGDNDQKIKALTFDFDKTGARLLVEDERGQHTVEIGSASWRLSTTSLDPRGPRQVAACGNWTSDDTYAIRLRYLSPAQAARPDRRAFSVPFGLTITGRFTENKALVDYKLDQSFVPVEAPTLEGRLA
jgi:CubicO group peptidase (beta-lactamase class C family)